MARINQVPKAHPEDVGMQVIGPFVVDFSTAGIAAGVQIGVIPSGSVVARTWVQVTTVFNAATTNVLTVGNAAVIDALMPAATAVAGTAGNKVTSGPNSTLTTPTTGDTPVFVRYTQSGTAATTGRAVVMVEFYPALDYGV
jgi:hypothetical protein